MKYSILLVIIFALFLSSCKNYSEVGKKHYVNALNYFNVEDYANSKLEINRAIEFDSTNLEYVLFLARTEILLNNVEIAIPLLEKSIANDFMLDSTNYYLGKCYFNKSSEISEKGGSDLEIDQNNKMAVEYFDKAIVENVKFYDAYIWKYKTLHNLNNFEEAILTMKSASSIFPDSFSLILYRAISKGQLGDLIGGRNDLTELIDNDKLNLIDNSIAYRFRGIFNFEENKLDLALLDYSKSLELDPESATVYRERAELYKKLNLKDEACIDYRKAADLGLVSLYDIIKTFCN